MRAVGRWGRFPLAARLATILAVFAISFVPRLAAPARFVTWDEPTWALRSVRFLGALYNGDLAQTFQREHPGVVTMWAGATGEALYHPPLAALDGPGDLNSMRDIVALLTALCVTAATMLLVPLVGWRTAAVAGTLLSFDPYLLAHSRVLHVDAIAASLALLAILCTLRWLRAVDPVHAGRGVGWLVGAGALIGLAVVEKSPMLAVGAFVSAVVTLRAVGDVVGGWETRREAVGRWLTAGAVVAVAAAVTYVAVWPAMWVAPVATFQRMLAYAAEGAGKAREAVFFNGRVTPDPGIALYLVAIPFRMTPLSLVSAVVGSVVAYREARRGRWTGAVLLAWAVVFVIAMGFGAKKFERYMLPAIPALDVVAAIGLVALAEGAARRLAMRRASRWSDGLAGWVPFALLVAAVAAQSIAVVRHRPYYLAEYNPLLGGGPAAARTLPVGWGEGSDLVVDWLNGRSGAESQTIATASDTLLTWAYLGRVVAPKKWREADWLVVMIDDRQIGEPEEILAAVGDRKPAHVVRLNGIDYAWIWKRP